MKLIPYNSARFDGGATSYAAQGLCSNCGRGAEYMNEKATRAYCETHAPKLWYAVNWHGEKITRETKRELLDAIGMLHGIETPAATRHVSGWEVQTGRVTWFLAHGIAELRADGWLGDDNEPLVEVANWG